MAAKPTPAVRVGPLEERHIPQVVEIERQVHSAPWSERSIRAELDQNQGTFIVAEAEGQVIAYAAMWVVVDEAHIINVAVQPDHQRQGLGRKLMLELLYRAQDQNAACATLEVRAGNTPAIRLYEQLGFQTVGLRKRYYPDNNEDAAVMWLHNLPTWSPDVEDKR